MKLSKVIIESITTDTLLKKVSKSVNEDLKTERERKLKKDFRAKVESDVGVVVEKYDQAYETPTKIHPQRAQLAEASGDVILTFQRGMKYKYDTRESLEKLVNGFEAEMGLAKVGEPWKTVAGKATKEGIHRYVWNQIMIKPERQDYRNMPGTLGFDFTLEVYSAKTSLTIVIKFSGRAI